MKQSNKLASNVWCPRFIFGCMWQCIHVCNAYIHEYFSISVFFFSCCLASNAIFRNSFKQQSEQSGCAESIAARNLSSLTFNLIQEKFSVNLPVSFPRHLVQKTPWQLCVWEQDGLRCNGVSTNKDQQYHHKPQQVSHLSGHKQTHTVTWPTNLFEDYFQLHPDKHVA